MKFQGSGKKTITIPKEFQLGKSALKVNITSLDKVKKLQKHPHLNKIFSKFYLHQPGNLLSTNSNLKTDSEDINNSEHKQNTLEVVYNFKF